MRPERFSGLGSNGGLLLAIVLLAILISGLVGVIPALGRNIPQAAIERDYTMGVVWAVLLAVSISFWPIEREDKRVVMHLWGAKCVVALGFMPFYEWNYGLDAYYYFSASHLPQFPGADMGFGRTIETMAGLTWLVARVVPDSYHAIKLTFAMVGLIAIYIIYRATARFLGHPDRRLLYAVGLFPSVLFWSSILGKDPVQLFAIALYGYGVVSWARTRERRFVALIAVGIVLSMYVRLWSGPILILPLLVFALVGIRGFFSRVLFAALAIGALGFAMLSVIDLFRLETVQDLVVRAGDFTQGWEGGSQIGIPLRFTSVGAMVSYAPRGMFTALFRPLPGEVRNVFGMLSGAENLVLLFLVALALVRARVDRLRDSLVAWAIVLVLTWSGAYGFFSYNLGSAVRFKLQVLPVMLLLLLYLSRPRQRETPATASSVDTQMAS